MSFYAPRRVGFPLWCAIVLTNAGRPRGAAGELPQASPTGPEQGLLACVASRRAHRALLDRLGPRCNGLAHRAHASSGSADHLPRLRAPLRRGARGLMVRIALVHMGD